MGYTNYWKQKKSFSDSEWKQIKDEYDYIKDVCNSIIIDQSKNDDEIVFNGINDNEHETFVLLKNVRTVAHYENEDLSFNFCKTAHKPYDMAVWHLLTFIKQYGIEISRDR
tara:strand:+ start:915 stop:1247 length:333 start_codon:yes stop_codon:yes gene_type:complete